MHTTLEYFMSVSSTTPSLLRMWWTAVHSLLEGMRTRRRKSASCNERKLIHFTQLISVLPQTTGAVLLFVLFASCSHPFFGITWLATTANYVLYHYRQTAKSVLTNDLWVGCSEKDTPSSWFIRLFGEITKRGSVRVGYIIWINELVEEDRRLAVFKLLPLDYPNFTFPLIPIPKPCHV